MDDYKKFLTENVVAEDKVITYRLLSRALKINVNVAKQMLYDFHKTQNEKRPGVVHATYLVYGIKASTGAVSRSQNGADGDVEMASSMPDAESLAEVVPTFTLSLIPEEQLKDALADFEEVSSIHVYSVGPHPTKDMALLADVAQEVLTLNGADERKASGTIANSHVRQRERKGGASVAAAVAAKPALKPSVKPALKQEAKESKPSFFKPAPSSTSTSAPEPAPPKVKEEAKSAQQSAETEKAAPSAPAKKPTPALKRGGSGGIMQAFSKAATKVKKEATSQPATLSGDDSSVQPLSDDGEDDSEMPLPKRRNVTEMSQSKKMREEELRRMMEDDDEEEEQDEEEKAASEDEPIEEPPVEPEPPKEEPEVVTASSGGRRRGKRKIMRKKQIMDDDGYLVTIQEPGWESFSEDEVAAKPKPKVASSAAAPAPAAAKSKKSEPKGSQGNIMSFFSKK
ncbi:DNA polymerase subunit Cdc27 [Lasiosphaeria ovina]|uniref:DNA polymerase delta subunit 3 n=1 Tax=Lasiosphaeria ovina TaxID=92902 RepID=A0AAE0TTQ7_9PEZI|nr:DNA polymerase subunit Cdc27 [Lasiosphaeria ovina]